jgi:bacteriocin biosynthesis cyclodehydratase domain-containing protein
MYRMCVIALDDFGAAVGDHLAQRQREVAVVQGRRRVDVAGLPPAGAYVLARSRQDPDLELLLDESVHHWRSLLLPLIVEHPHLRIGPLVVPGAGACAGCHHARRRQHWAGGPAQDALEDLYREDPAVGPAGFLPMSAQFAADIATGLLERALLGDTGDAGTVRRLGLLTQETQRSTVVGVHGCPRCGLGRDETTRSYARLLNALAEPNDVES